MAAPTIAVTSVKLSESEKTIKVGETFTLEATITPANASNKTVTWKSSNDNVATVSKEGVVEGVGVGSIGIVATADEKTAKCTVTVEALCQRVQERRLIDGVETIIHRETGAEDVVFSDGATMTDKLGTKQDKTIYYGTGEIVGSDILDFKTSETVEAHAGMLLVVGLVVPNSPFGRVNDIIPDYLVQEYILRTIKIGETKYPIAKTGGGQYPCTTGENILLYYDGSYFNLINGQLYWNSSALEAWADTVNSSLSDLSPKNDYYLLRLIEIDEGEFELQAECELDEDDEPIRNEDGVVGTDEDGKDVYRLITYTHDKVEELDNPGWGRVGYDEVWKMAKKTDKRIVCSYEVEDEDGDYGAVAITSNISATRSFTGEREICIDFGGTQFDSDNGSCDGALYLWASDRNGDYGYVNGDEDIGGADDDMRISGRLAKLENAINGREIARNKVSFINETNTDNQYPSAKAVYTAIETLKTSVSSGKALVAAAVTDKGVQTAAMDSFETIAKNIRAIENSPMIPPLGSVEGLDYCLRFSSRDSFTLEVNAKSNGWDGTLEWTDGWKDWAEWDRTTKLSADKGVLYLRGTGNTILNQTATGKGWILVGSENIRCDGNIETLLDYATVAAGNHPAMGDRCYACLFLDCTALTTAPTLPATTLASSCYNGMFRGCTSLIAAPELPATTLTSNCYYAMFQNCTALTAAPELPATTLVESCYNSMFEDCVGLNDIRFDLRHVEVIIGDSLADFGCTICFSTPLRELDANAFGQYDVQTNTIYYDFTDSDTVAFDTDHVLTPGSADKGSARTYNIYTDNTTIKNAALAKVDEYTIVNVYHLNGSDWT